MKTEVLIIGGGPAGSSSAMFLLREGIKPVIVEAAAFPRYHVGESLTGAGGKVLRDLGLEAEMYRRGYPIKRGVTVFGQSQGGTWFVPVAGRDENWNLYDWETWQVRRSDFDQMLLNKAVARGATLLPGKALMPLVNGSGVCGAKVRMSDGGVLDIQADLVLDCSGQATWLANLNATGQKYLGAYDKQIAIFSQVSNAIRDNGNTRESHKDNTLIFYQKKYHWAWFIPIDAEVVSVGVVIPAAYFLGKKESKRDFLLRELRELHPELSKRIPEPQFVEDVHVITNYSYQVRNFCGKGYMCIGDSHRFLDPIFSFGLTVALREAQFAAPVIRSYLESGNRLTANPFADIQLFFEQGIDILEDVLDCFWENPLAFSLFVHQRYTEYMTDMFAGRIYGHERQPSPALHAFRKLLGREGEREKSYGSEDLFSIPVGSRFHPERAQLWTANSVVDSTEDWLEPR